MGHDRTFVVIGDPILDIYHEGKIEPNGRFLIKKTETVRGGALNVWANLRAMNNDKGVYFTDFVRLKHSYPTYQEDDQIYSVTRYIDSEGYCFFETSKDFKYRPHKSYAFAYPSTIVDALFDEHSKANERKVLVIADYNKGVASSQSSFKQYKPERKIDLCIVDSRYRSFEPKLLKSSQVKIWRCTGDEYNPEYATRYFDYVVWSNGPGKVFLMESSAIAGLSGKYYSLDVPQTTPVNTCGAGDTLTAALAGWLGAHGKRLDLDDIGEAVEFGIECCQEVILKPKTAVTTIKLKD